MNKCVLKNRKSVPPQFSQGDDGQGLKKLLSIENYEQVGNIKEL